MGFQGYPRPNGKFGVRNYVVVMSSVVCANGAVEAIARAVPGVKPITHPEGCGRGPEDVMRTVRTLTGLGCNPNVAAVLLVGLGCEVIRPEFIQAGIAATGKPVRAISIQAEGGSRKTVALGAQIAREFLADAAKVQRVDCDWANLTLGLECGGSDAMSGVTANPLVGFAVDWLVGEGGAAILSETTEMIGTEYVLAARAADPATGKRVVDLIQGQQRLTHQILGSMADSVISPGNMDGGLTTIQEKSLGCVIKGGTTAINQVLEYGEVPKKKGLLIMDTPGSDIFSITAMAAGGAQVILFTTGRGTPAGFPLVPVVKIASNSRTFLNMEDDMDVDAGRIIAGLPLATAGRELIELVRQVADGEPTKAERNANDLFAIHTTGPSF